VRSSTHGHEAPHPAIPSGADAVRIVQSARLKSQFMASHSDASDQCFAGKGLPDDLRVSVPGSFRRIADMESMDLFEGIASADPAQCMLMARRRAASASHMGTSGGNSGSPHSRTLPSCVRCAFEHSILLCLCT
jgi:hypothetical protein